MPGPFTQGAIQMIKRQQLHPRVQSLAPGADRRHGRTLPTQHAIVPPTDGIALGHRQLGGPAADLAAENPVGGGAQGAALGQIGGGIGFVFQSPQAAHILPLDQDLALAGNRGQQITAFLQAPDQRGRAPVHETLGQGGMQGVGQGILDPPRALLPMAGIIQPIRLVRDIGPGPDMGDAASQGIDIAIGAVQAAHMPVDPIGRNLALARAAVRRQKAEHPVQHAMVRFRHGLGKIGDAANIP